MIVTSVKSPELELYSELNEYFPKAFDVIRSVLANTPADGKYEIDGNDCYYMVQSYQTKSPFEVSFESHREYIDIQVVISGEEIIRFESIDKLSLSKQYAPDCERFAMNKDYDSVRLCRGDISIIFPNEPHAPAIRADGSGPDVRKLVVKIRKS